MNLPTRLLLLATVALATPASAGDPGKGKELYEKGRAAYASGNYAEAIRLFEECYAVSNRASLLFNVASAHRKQFEVDHDVTHLRRARIVYENYASVATSLEAAEYRDRVQRARALIRAGDCYQVNLTQRLTAPWNGSAIDRKSTRLNSSHIQKSRMPSSA